MTALISKWKIPKTDLDEWTDAHTTWNQYALSAFSKLGSIITLCWVYHKLLTFKQRSCLMTKATKWYVCPANTQISLDICPVWSESLLCAQWVAKDPGFLHADSEDCPGSSESSLGPQPHCWFCHEAAQRLLTTLGELQSDFCKNITEFYRISLKNLPQLRFQSTAYGMYANHDLLLKNSLLELIYFDSKTQKRIKA